MLFFKILLCLNKKHSFYNSKIFTYRRQSILERISYQAIRRQSGYSYSVSRAASWDSILSRVKPMTSKLLFTASLVDVRQTSTVWRTNRQVYLLYRWEKHLAEFPHLKVVGRWPATPKRARYSAFIAFSWQGLKAHLENHECVCVCVCVYVSV